MLAVHFFKTLQIYYDPKIGTGGNKDKQNLGHKLKKETYTPVSYTHLRAHETREHLVCRLLLEK